MGLRARHNAVEKGEVSASAAKSSLIHPLSSLSSPCSLNLGRTSWSVQRIGGQVDPRASLDDVGKRNFVTLMGL